MADEPTQDAPVQDSADDQKTTTAAKLKAVKEKAPPPEARAGLGVHYVYNGTHVACSVLEVFEDGSVRLKADDNSFSASPISFDDSGAEGCWHLPEE